jgi:hypothetical protein
LKHPLLLIEHSDRTLQESPLLQIVFVYDGGGFGRKLSPFLHQAFNVFPNQVGFEIDLIADLLEA